MDIKKLATGKNVPHEINVVIEVPMGANPVKYELDKDSGALFVDRFLSTAMFYPCNYGFIPNTLSGDGDPADVLVVSTIPVQPSSVIAARPIGVLLMEDESGVDEKILAVPTTKLTQFYSKIESYKDLPEILIQQISHFFEHYKDLEKGKWVKVLGWKDAATARKLIEEAVVRANPKAAKAAKAVKAAPAPKKATAPKKVAAPKVAAKKAAPAKVKPAKAAKAPAKRAKGK